MATVAAVVGLVLFAAVGRVLRDRQIAKCRRPDPMIAPHRAGDYR